MASRVAESSSGVDPDCIAFAVERDYPDQVEELIAAEHNRRERNRKKKAREKAKKAEAAPPTVAGPLFDDQDGA